MRGGSRSSRTRGGMRWTRQLRIDESKQRGRRSRVVPTPRRWRQVSRKYPRGDGGKKARSPGRARKKPLKPLRGECRVISGVTVVTNARVYYTPRAAAGAPGARHSLRPLILGESCTHNSGALRRENVDLCPTSLPATNAKRLRKGACHRARIRADPLARNDDRETSRVWLFENRICNSLGRCAS